MAFVKVDGEVLAACRLELRIEEHVDAGQFAHRLEQHLGRLVVHLEVLICARDRLQLGNRQHATRRGRRRPRAPPRPASARAPRAWRVAGFFFSLSIISRVRRISCSAIAEEGSIA